MRALDDQIAEQHAITIVDLLRDIAKMQDRQISRDGITYKIPADTNPVHVLEPNRFRHLVTIYNDSTAVMYLALGANAGLDQYTVKLAAGDYYETPAGYTGPISAVWASVNGQARVT